MNKIEKIVEEICGPIPKDIGRIVDIPITEDLTKKELLAVIWYIQKDIEKREMNEFSEFYYNKMMKTVK